MPIFSGNGALSRMQLHGVVNEGHKVLLFCGIEKDQEQKEQKIDGLEIVPIPINSSKTLVADSDYKGFSNGIIENLEKIKEFAPDAIISVDWHASIACTTIIKIEYFLNLPLIYLFYRCFSRSPEFIDSIEDFKRINEMERNLAKISTVAITLNKNDSNWISKNFKIKSSTNYPAIPSEFIKFSEKFNNDNISHQHSIKEPPRLNLICFVRISPEKELERIIKLAGGFSFPYQLKIFGGIIDKEYNHSLLKLVEQLNLKEKIIFGPRLDRMKLFQEIKRNDIYIHPCRYEAFGISIMESAFNGLPIILDDTETIGAGELLVDGESCIRLNYNNNNSSNQKLIKYLEDSDYPKNLKEIGLNAQKIALTLTISNNTKKLIQIIRNHI
jgi:glycosyltransferase involved in cell wall biosynthesis